MRIVLFVFFCFSFYDFFSQDTIKVIKNLTPDEQAQEDYNAGLLAIGKGEFQAAIDLLSKSIATKPDFEKAYYNRGIAFTSLKKYPEAAADINKVIASNPKNQEAYFAKDLLYFNQKMKDSK